MRIERTNEGYKASQKLPDGSMVVGTGYTVEHALAWATWGVKAYWARLERAKKVVRRGFGKLLAGIGA